MNLAHAPVYAAFTALAVSGAMMVSDACAPRGGDGPGRYVEPATRIGCILLRAFTSDGRLDEVCATAEDLAPLIGEILASHEANVREAGPSAVPPSPVVAFAISTPKRPAPKRRCEKWVLLGPAEAGTDR